MFVNRSEQIGGAPQIFHCQLEKQCFTGKGPHPRAGEYRNRTIGDG
jgi:hypothetical protein